MATCGLKDREPTVLDGEHGAEVLADDPVVADLAILWYDARELPLAAHLAAAARSCH
jgi:hypothetical protein